MKRNKLKRYFDSVTPDEELRQRTMARLEEDGRQPARPKRRFRITPKLVTLSLLSAVVLFFVLAGAIRVRLELGENAIVRFQTEQEVKNYVAASVRREQAAARRGMLSSCNIGCSAKGTAPDPGGDSETNTQVDGVDEADIVKNVNGTIYSFETGKINSGIRIYNTADRTASRIVLKKFLPSEMFVYGGRLAVFGRALNTDGSHAGYGVQLFEVSDPENPVQVRELSFQDANYVTSRRTDGMVYLVLNNHNYGYYRTKDAKLPRYYDSFLGGGRQLDARNIFAVPNGGVGLNYIYVIAFDMTAEREIDFKAFFGNAHEVYATRDALYTASNRYEYKSNLLFGTVRDRNSSVTTINRLTLEGGIEPHSTVTLAGMLLDQFSMDEYKGTFRVATTVRNASGNSGSVYVLKIGENSMELAGIVKGLGKNESIYAVRFDGDTGYVVTARRTDPLFVLDLSDSSAPKVLGEYKTPDVSDYLHRVDENTLLGIGRTAQGNNRFYGVKLSLFDVSDKTDPKKKCEDLVLSELFGSEVYSDITTQHKALLYYTAGGKTVFGFPAYYNSPESSYRNRYCYLLFEITENGLRLVGDLPLRGGENDRAQRGVVVNGTLYVVSDGCVTEWRLDTAGDAATVSEGETTLL